LLIVWEICDADDGSIIWAGGGGTIGNSNSIVLPLFWIYGVPFSMDLFCLAESGFVGSTFNSILFWVVSCLSDSLCIILAGVILLWFTSSLIFVLLFVVEFLMLDLDTDSFLLFADFALTLLFVEALPWYFYYSFKAFDLEIFPSFFITAGSGSFSGFSGFLCFLFEVLTNISSTFMLKSYWDYYSSRILHFCLLNIFAGLERGATKISELAGGGRRESEAFFLILLTEAGFIKFFSSSNLTSLPGVFLSIFSLSLESLFRVEDLFSSLKTIFGDGFDVFFALYLLEGFSLELD